LTDEHVIVGIHRYENGRFSLWIPVHGLDFCEKNPIHSMPAGILNIIPVRKPGA
jgi:hypothetical protein